MPDLSAALPTYLRQRAQWTRLGDHVPALTAHPDRAAGTRVPVVVWMHGRTVTKELDPGRYLRWLRAGIGVCALDLPGHGERFDAALQHPDRTLDVILQMSEEIDGVVAALRSDPGFDSARIAIGGMSAGGMATIRRLTREHEFVACSLEATTGSWRHQRDREMFEHLSEETLASLDPIQQLDQWREIPVQAIHSRLDEWVDYDGQAAFIDALRSRYAAPSLIDFVSYDQTGAPFEHAGFGTMAADAKERQRDFLDRHLLGSLHA